MLANAIYDIADCHGVESPANVKVLGFVLSVGVIEAGGIALVHNNMEATLKSQTRNREK